MSSVYDYFIATLQGLSCITKARLLATYKSAKEIWEADEVSLSEIGLLNAGQIKVLTEGRDEHRLTCDYEEMIESGVKLCTISDSDYPKMLRDIPDPPYGIFYKGSLPGEDEKLVSIVGARRCSEYGQTMARDLAISLSKHGYSVVSGMARGIDGYAHDGALVAKGKTYGVLGCGPDICYPRCNRELYNAIIQSGGIISEYAPGTPPMGTFFPLRNRIISGLSKTVIVVEAKEKSGSLITADLALEQGREVYAVPGRTIDEMSRGCNQLIAQGAGVICSKESLISDMEDLSGLTEVINPSVPQKELKLEKDENKVYSCFDFYAKSIDRVQCETGMDLLKLLSVIMRLCEKGLIRETFKNEYIRLA